MRLLLWTSIISNGVVLGLDLARYIKRRRAERDIRAAGEKLKADFANIFAALKCECPDCTKAAEPPVLQ